MERDLDLTPGVLAERLESVRHEIISRGMLTDQRFVDQQRAVDAALASAEKAVQAALASTKEAILKAEAAVNVRLAGMNEIRGILNDTITRVVPREVFDEAIRHISDRHEVAIKILTDRIDVGLSSERRRGDFSAGQTKGKQITMANLVTVVGISLAALGLFITVALRFLK